MTDWLYNWMTLTWRMLEASAFLLFVGFALAGLLRAFITPTSMTWIFGSKPLTQVLRASLFGIPLPLCSCSVLPVAAQLQQTGLSRAGTVSFLVSTPETGVDSIALSYRLLGPWYMVIRPLAALIVAFGSGVAIILFGGSRNPTPLPMAIASPAGERVSRGVWGRLVEGQTYIAKDVLPELAYYLFWGYILAGLAAAIIPGDLIERGIDPWMQYLVIISISVPLYVCATSSTPLAAVLLSLGITPGAVLVFLLVGPATNVTSLIVQKKLLGLRTTVVMTSSVVVLAVLIGLVVDIIVPGGLPLPNNFGTAVSGESAGSLFEIAAAAALAAVMIYFTGRHYYRKAGRRRK